MGRSKESAEAARGEVRPLRLAGTGERQRDGLVLAGLVLLSLAFYARAAGFDFVDYDDRTIVLAHPNLYDETSLRSSLRQIFVGYFPREEPLPVRDVTWALDARLYGFENPFGYHLGNVVLNALVVGLLYGLLRRWLRSRSLAGWLCLAFALLPVHVEPVCWVMGRKDLLVALFMLSGLLAQSAELASRTPRRRRLAWAGHLACCALALGSKISAVSFPLVLGLHRAFQPWLEGSRDPRAPFAWREALRRSVPALLPHLALSLVVFTWYRTVLHDYGIIESGGPGPLSAEHLANVARFLPLVAGQYLESLFAPRELSVYYRWPNVGIPLGTGEQLASVLWAAGLLGVLFLALWRRRDLAFFALLGLALILPYTGLFYVGFWRADRYLYLASAALLAPVGLLLRDLLLRAPAARPWIAALVGVFLVASGVEAFQHQAVWRDNRSLWEYEVARSEPSLFAFQSLGKEYLRRARSAATSLERERWLARTQDVVARGFARNDALGRVPSDYHTPEQLHVARLYELKGRVAGLRGAPKAVQVRDFQRAFDLAPNRRTALFLSGALYDEAVESAEPQRARLVEQSFDYFLRYLDYSSTDARRLAVGRRLLESNYAGRFPFLETRVASARQAYFP